MQISQILKIKTINSKSWKQSGLPPTRYWVTLNTNQSYQELKELWSLQDWGLQQATAPRDQLNVGSGITPPVDSSKH